MNADELREMGLEKTARYTELLDPDHEDVFVRREHSDAMRDELLARIEELTDENADLRLNMTKDGLLVRMQEANQNGYECGRSLAEAERFMLEKERDAEKQRADEAEAQVRELESGDAAATPTATATPPRRTTDDRQAR